MYRATLASRATNDPETGGRKDVLAGSAAQEEKPGADRSGSTNGAVFDEPDYTIRGLLLTSIFALLAGVLAGAPLGIRPQCFSQILNLCLSVVWPGVFFHYSRSTPHIKTHFGWAHDHKSCH